MRKMLARFALPCLLVASIGVTATILARHYARRFGPPIAAVEVANRRVVARPDASKVFAKFAITNAGGSVLSLTKASTSCGCTVASIRPAILTPGERGVIDVEGNPPTVGQKIVTISVATNDPKRREITLSLTMVGTTKAPYINGSSGPIRFGSIRPVGTPEPIWVETIESSGSKPWLARALSSRADLQIHGGLAEELPYTGEAVVRHYRYSAGFRAVPAPGEIRAEVTFHEARNGTPSLLQLPLSGVVRAAVYPSPAALFAVVDPHKPRPKLILRLAAEEAHPPLQVRPVEGVTQGVEIRELSRTGEGFVFEILPPEVGAASSSTTLRFKTNQSAMPEVQVPLLVRRSEP